MSIKPQYSTLIDTIIIINYYTLYIRIYEIIKIWLIIKNGARTIVDTYFHASCVLRQNTTKQHSFPYIWRRTMKGSTK